MICSFGKHSQSLVDLRTCQTLPPSLPGAGIKNSSAHIHRCLVRFRYDQPDIRANLQIQRESTARSVLCRSHAEIDQDFIDAINEASNQTLAAMLDNSEAEAARVAAELQDMRMYLEAEGDLESSLFLKTLQGMLHHTLLKDAGKLEGMYQQALNRICNQVAGSDWRLTEEGKNAELPDVEPSFSTWDDVMGKKGRASSGSQASTSAPVNSGAGVRDTTFYRLLEVAESASAAEIKAAYRAKALKVHPDVSSAPDATEKFAELSHAYDVLSDATARSLYDRYGPEGMKQQAGADSGRGNAREAWDEFKPYKKENKRTKARDAARASVSMDDADAQVADDGLPQFGDVVEYPLREIEMRELQDGRTAGVGLVVGRNMDRGDAKKLPPDQLDLCEIEPLRQEETGSDRWFPDDLGIPSFARLGELRKLPVLDYDGRYDIWVINAPLSEGCGGPELPEEIML